MRVWLQKQKKKEDAKAAAQATPAPPESPVVTEAQAQLAAHVADKPVDSVEELPQAEGSIAEETVVEGAGDADKLADATANEVGLCLSFPFSHLRACLLRSFLPDMGMNVDHLARIKMILAARASDMGLHLTCLEPVLIPVRILRPLKPRRSDAPATLRRTCPKA